MRIGSALREIARLQGRRYLPSGYALISRSTWDRRFAATSLSAGWRLLLVSLKMDFALARQDLWTALTAGLLQRTLPRRTWTSQARPPCYPLYDHRFCRPGIVVPPSP